MRRVSAFIIAAAVSLVAGACDSTEPRGPGSIFISSSATNPEPGSSFYQYEIVVDNGSPRAAHVFENVSFMVNGLAPGAHEVRLGGIPAFCNAGQNPRTVNLRGDDTALVIFRIECQRVTGDLRVSVSTTGSDPDLNGYLVLIGGLTAGFLPSNGQFTFPYVPAGTHTVTLSDVATNCAHGGPQNVTITAGQLSTVTFTVTCTPVAVLKVVTATTGDEPDVDGYTITTGSPSSAARVPANGTTHMRVGTGTVNWQLSDIQPNCSMDGATSGSVTVAAGDTVTIGATATCTSIGYGTAGTTAMDPSADTLPNNSSNANPAHDFVQISARYAPDWLIVVARFTKPVGGIAGSPGSLHGVLDFDIDENSGTGAPPLINAWGGNANQGSDKRILFYQGNARLLTAVPVDTFTHLVPVTVEGDSVVMKIPLAKLAGDDGRLSITSVIGTHDRPTDILPNSGVFLARSASALVANGNAVALTAPGSAPRVKKGAAQWPPSGADYKRDER